MFENQNKIVRIIRRLIFMNFTRGEILFLAFKDSELAEKWPDFIYEDNFEIDEIFEQIDLARNDGAGADKFKEEHNESLLEALQLINNEYYKAERSIKARECPDAWCEFEPLSQRYAVNIRGEKDDAQEFILFDLLHGQKRRLKIDGQIPANSLCSLAAINSDHFLYISQEREKFTAFLMRLNLAVLGCKLTDSKILDGHFIKLTVDERNPKKFVILSNCSSGTSQDYEGTDYFHCGQILDSELLQFGQPLKSDFSCVYYKALRLEDDKLYALLPQTNQFMTDFEYKVLTLGQDKMAQVKQCIIRQKMYSSEDELDGSYFSWLNSEICYVLYPLHYEVRSDLYKIDIKARKMTRVDHFGPEYASGMTIDKNGVMNMRTGKRHWIGEKGYSYVWYRFPLLNSDKLKNLALASIAEYAFFLNENEHKKFVEKLPQKWRPFGGNC